MCGFPSVRRMFIRRRQIRRAGQKVRDDLEREAQRPSPEEARRASGEEHDGEQRGSHEDEEGVVPRAVVETLEHEAAG